MCDLSEAKKSIQVAFIQLDDCYSDPLSKEGQEIARIQNLLLEAMNKIDLIRLGK